MDKQFVVRAAVLMCEGRWSAVATPNQSLHRTRYGGLRPPARAQRER
jgi:hypothetical protein